ncbi:MAG: hypothetical protein H7257_03040 [Taibaiella sp.]|nr:hypothetical protein [Taibaiella sp.]
MKKHILYIPALALLATGFASCGSSTESSTTTTTDSTASSLSPGDSAVTTTTTTTTTHHEYAGAFMPKSDMKYYDLRAKKQVRVRIDTNMGYIVNYETNEPVDLFVAPNSTDTIYGRTGNVANTYIIHTGNDYSVDEARMTGSTSNMNSTPTDAQAQQAVEAVKADKPDGNYKEKVRGNKTKIKTDDLKIKEKNGEVKVKER